MSNNINNRRITIAEMAPHVHSFASGENKVNKISDWLILWIEKNLKDGNIAAGDFLPAKSDLAFHTGVSMGTIQNVFRQVEDKGLIASKQKVGTYVVGNKVAQNSKLKNISKREEAASLILNYLMNSNLKKGDKILSIRKIAALINISPATVRTAIMYLTGENILCKKEKNYFINNLPTVGSVVKSKTLVKKIAEKIRSAISNNEIVNGRLQTNIQLAEKYGVSVKTIHDAIKILSKEGILYSKRGKYGTIVIDNNKIVYSYKYEQICMKIKHYITDNLKIGDKLPSIIDFSKKYNVSTKTVKKALDELAQDGYLAFSRGRNGGTFVLDVPETSEDAYKWLVLNPKFLPEY